MINPLYQATIPMGGSDTSYNAPKVLGVRIHADQSFSLQYTLTKGDGTTAYDIDGATSQLYVTAYKGSGYTPVLLVSGVHSDSGHGGAFDDVATFNVPSEAIPEDIANFPLRNPGNAVFYAIITDSAGKLIEIVAEVNIFDTDYSLTGEAAPSDRVIIPKANDLGTVENLTTTVPPTPTLNIAYIVGPSATGDWSGQDDDLAIGTGTAWVFLTPVEGNFVYDKATDSQYVFDTSWTTAIAPPFTDASALIKNDSDNTKLIKFDASAITTGTERTITMPDANVDLGDVSTALQDVVDDTTPQLGGFLDAQDNRISSLLGIGAKTATVLDIATGAVTQTQIIHNIGTESAAAADDLDSIVPATGQTEIFITMNDAAEVPTIKHATGTNTFLLADDTDLLMVMNTFYHFHHDGTNWKLIGSSASGALSVGIWQSQRASSTGDGTGTASTWQTRVLNTEVADPDGIGTLSANAVTLGAGKYLIEAVYGSEFYQSAGAIYDGSTRVAFGDHNAVTTYYGQKVHTYYYADISVNTAYSIQMWTASATTNHHGLPFAAPGTTNIYSTLKVIKVG